jgi:hypothetical protein
MSGITKCEGVYVVESIVNGKKIQTAKHCPLIEDCIRYKKAVDRKRDFYFDHAPYDEERQKCGHFDDRNNPKSSSLDDYINDILNGGGDKVY